MRWNSSKLLVDTIPLKDSNSGLMIMNPEFPILQGPAFHIFIKHVSHVVKLAAVDWDSCGR